MATTIEDVAREAGVSTATVSRALRGLPNVAPSTRERIIHIAEEMDYLVSPQVTRKALGRKSIGMLLPLTDQWFYSKLTSIIEIQLIHSGLDVFQYSIDSLENQNRLIKHLTSSRLVDGLILISFSIMPDEEHILREANIPTVTVEVDVHSFPSVCIDNMSAAELATRHLVNLGHRKIGFISGLDNDPMHFSIPQARRKGYEGALQSNGIPLRTDYRQDGNFSYKGGAEAMKRLFSIHDPPSAVFAISDEMAIGALKTIRDLNLQVPDDISVIGFDDNDVSQFVGLTTIRQPVVEMGEAAADLIKKMIRENESSEVTNVELPAHLIVRSTTGPHQASR